MLRPRFSRYDIIRHLRTNPELTIRRTNHGQRFQGVLDAKLSKFYVAQSGTSVTSPTVLWISTDFFGFSEDISGIHVPDSCFSGYCSRKSRRPIIQLLWKYLLRRDQELG